METNKISERMDQLNKVVELLNIAKEINILQDNHFDILMDKFEQNKMIFGFMYDHMISCLSYKVPADVIADDFIKFIDVNTYGDYISSGILPRGYNSDSFIL